MPSFIRILMVLTLQNITESKSIQILYPRHITKNSLESHFYEHSTPITKSGTTIKNQKKFHNIFELNESIQQNKWIGVQINKRGSDSILLCIKKASSYKNGNTNPKLFDKNVLEIQPDKNGCDLIGFNKTEEFLFVKKLYPEQAFQTLFIDNEENNNSRNSTDITIIIKDYIPKKCPRKCKGGKCIMGFCKCATQGHMIGRFCDRPLEKKSLGDHGSLHNVPAYNSVFFEIDQEKPTGEKLQLKIEEVRDDESLPLNMNINDSGMKNLDIPFRKDIDDFYIKNTDSRKIKIFDKNSKKETFSFTIPRRYLYISQLNSNSSKIIVYVKFINSDSSEESIRIKEEQELELQAKFEFLVIIVIVIQFIAQILSILCICYCAKIIQEDCEDVQEYSEDPEANADQTDDPNGQESSDDQTLNIDDLQKLLKPFAYSMRNTNIEKFEQDTCSICIDTLDNGEKLRRIPMCQHLFHDECQISWLNNEQICPNCKVVISKRELSKYHKVKEDKSFLKTKSLGEKLSNIRKGNFIFIFTFSYRISYLAWMLF